MSAGSQNWWSVDAYHIPNELNDRQLSGARRFAFYVL